MKNSDYLEDYIKLAPLQLALWRTPELVVWARCDLEEPILDLGCGDGVFTSVLFSGKKKNIIGIDINPKTVKLAKKKEIFQKVIVANAQKLPFKNESFETVISNSSIEHFEDVDRAFLVVARILEKGGRFIFAVPSVYLDEYWLTSALTRRIPRLGKMTHAVRNKIFGHKNILTRKEWSEKLKRANFEPLKYTYIDNKAACFLSDLFWPLRLLQIAMTRLLKRKVLFPRLPALFLAKVLNGFLERGEKKRPKKGSTVLIVARKTQPQPEKVVSGYSGAV